MTAGIPVLDTAPEIRPASDEEIKSWRINNDPGAVGMMTVGLPKMQTDKRGMMRLIARIEADRARIAELEAKIDILMDPCPDCGHAMTLDDEGAPLCEMCILHATIAKQAEEIAEFRTAISAFLEQWALVKPHIDSAFAFQQNHGVYYTGPTIRAQIDDLRAVLSKPEPGR